MDRPLDELYFVWLYGQVGDPELKNPNLTYWRMFKQLYTKEFVWIIPNDDNRVEDGRDLRYEFIEESGLNDVDPHWLKLGCCMFELLIGLSRRLSFEADGEPRAWFWELLKNVGLHVYDDGLSVYPEEVVGEMLDRIVWRTYEYDGRGGLFPLRDPQKDQREVELWYQLSAYVLEMD